MITIDKVHENFREGIFICFVCKKAIESTGDITRPVKFICIKEQTVAKYDNGVVFKKELTIEKIKNNDHTIVKYYKDIKICYPCWINMAGEDWCFEE